MKPIRFSQLKDRSALEPIPAIEDIKLQAITGSGSDATNFNINASDLVTGPDAVDQTFNPTSQKAQSGVALSFLEPKTDSIALTYNTSQDGDVYKVKVSQGDIASDGPYISWTIGEGEAEQVQETLSFKNLHILSDYGYVQEAASATSSSGSQGFIEDSIQAALENGRVISEVELVGHGIVSLSNPLTEGNIAYCKMDYTTAADASLDLSALSITRYGTAEIWIDIPSDLPDSSTTNKEPSFTWPVSDSGETSWLELSAPETLSRGNRYVIVIRNDGSATGSHYCLNLAYQLPLSKLG